MAKQVVVFTRAHRVEHLATVLESVSGNERTHIADIPARVDEYTVGQCVEFRSKKDALAFIKAMNGAAELRLT